MKDHRLIHIPGCTQQGDQTGQIMTVCRSQVGKAHILKQGTGQQEPLQPVFQMAGSLVKGFAKGQLLHHPAVPLLGIQVVLTGAQTA